VQAVGAKKPCRPTAHTGSHRVEEVAALVAVAVDVARVRRWVQPCRPTAHTGSHRVEEVAALVAVAVDVARVRRWVQPCRPTAHTGSHRVEEVAALVAVAVDVARVTGPGAAARVVLREHGAHAHVALPALLPRRRRQLHPATHTRRRRSGWGELSWWFAALSTSAGDGWTLRLPPAGAGFYPQAGGPPDTGKLHC
jgi:hypothetical protein